MILLLKTSLQARTQMRLSITGLLLLESPVELPNQENAAFPWNLRRVQRILTLRDSMHNVPKEPGDLSALLSLLLFVHEHTSAYPS